MTALNPTGWRPEMGPAQHPDAERVHRRIRDAIARWPDAADAASSPIDLRALIDAVAQEE